MALAAKNQLEKRLVEQKDGMVRIDNLDYDKYGRLLAMVTHKGEDLSQWIKNNFLGVDYDGKSDKNALTGHYWRVNGKSNMLVMKRTSTNKKKKRMDKPLMPGKMSAWEKEVVDTKQRQEMVILVWDRKLNDNVNEMICF